MLWYGQELLNRGCVLHIPIIMDVFTLPEYSIEEYPKRRKIWQRQLGVVVDAMGGDNAPAEPVKAAVEAVTREGRH